MTLCWRMCVWRCVLIIYIYRVIAVRRIISETIKLFKILILNTIFESSKNDRFLKIKIVYIIITFLGWVRIFYFSNRFCKIDVFGVMMVTHINKNPFTIYRFSKHRRKTSSTVLGVSLNSSLQIRIFVEILRRCIRQIKFWTINFRPTIRCLFEVYWQEVVRRKMSVHYSAHP